MNNLPNLLIVGAAKSGTTSLHNYINQHPDVFMCSPKEPHFLINNEIGKQRVPNGISNLEEYKRLFSTEEEYKFKGESSVMYLSFPEITISNIKKYLDGDVKIIIMLRNPVDRAYSGYQHVKRYNVMETLSFEDALSKSADRYNNKKNMTPASRYLELGMYFEQVKVFKQAFKDVHVIIYDDYKSHFDEEMEKVFRFLNISAIKVNTSQKHMVGGWEWNNDLIKKIMMGDNFLKSFLRFMFPKKIRLFIRSIIQRNSVSEVQLMKPETREWLKDYYKNDVSKLAKLLARDLNKWAK